MILLAPVRSPFSLSRCLSLSSSSTKFVNHSPHHSLRLHSNNNFMSISHFESNKMHFVALLRSIDKLFLLPKKHISELIINWLLAKLNEWHKKTPEQTTTSVTESNQLELVCMRVHDKYSSEHRSFNVALFSLSRDNLQRTHCDCEIHKIYTQQTVAERKSGSCLL